MWPRARRCVAKDNLHAPVVIKLTEEKVSALSRFPQAHNPMNTLVKVQPKGQMTIPRRVRSAVGLVDGDLVEVRAVGKKIVITPHPQLVIGRSGFPNADDEYTPAQRRIIDAQLDEAAKGPFNGPFNTAEEMIAHMKGELKKRAAAKKTKRSR